MSTRPNWYITIYCIPLDGGPKRECVKNWPVSKIMGSTLEQALVEARKVCPFDECDLDIQVRLSPLP